MKQRLPLIVSFILFLALCASAAFWGPQIFKPKVRAITAPPAVAQAELPIDGAVGLFGGKMVAAASNIQLKGVIAASNPGQGIAILAADGSPPESVPAGKAMVSGVVVKEVYAQYVMLDEGGVAKRLDMPEGGRSLPPGNGALPPPAPPPPPPTASMSDQGAPPPPPQALHNATGLNPQPIRIGEPNAGVMMGSNPGGVPASGAPESTPKPAMPHEPGGPPVDK